MIQSQYFGLLHLVKSGNCASSSLIFSARYPGNRYWLKAGGVAQSSLLCMARIVGPGGWTWFSEVSKNNSRGLNVRVTDRCIFNKRLPISSAHVLLKIGSRPETGKLGRQARKSFRPHYLCRRWPGFAPQHYCHRITGPSSTWTWSFNTVCIRHIPIN